MHAISHKEILRNARKHSKIIIFACEIITNLVLTAIFTLIIITSLFHQESIWSFPEWNFGFSSAHKKLCEEIAYNLICQILIMNYAGYYKKLHTIHSKFVAKKLLCKSCHFHYSHWTFCWTTVNNHSLLNMQQFLFAHIRTLIERSPTNAAEAHEILIFWMLEIAFDIIRRTCKKLPIFSRRTRNMHAAKTTFRYQYSFGFCPLCRNKAPAEPIERATQLRFRLSFIF